MTSNQNAAAPALTLRAGASGYSHLRFRRDGADLARWAERIQAQPWSEAYVYFKHEDDGAAPKLALRLMDLCGSVEDHRANSDG
jgi:uncharacterized protein YecE (DUF72 family)